MVCSIFMGLDRDVYAAVVSGRRELVPDLVRSALARGARPEAVIDETLLPALHEMGERYAAHGIEIPELLLSARAMEAGLTVVEPALPHREPQRRLTVCIGTVKGDRHGLGKNIVAMMLRAAGYRVVDLGVDCDADRFLRAVEEGARAALCSALMTRSLRYLGAVTEHLAARAPVPVLVGGAPVTADYATRIGAAGYGATAAEAVREVGRLLGA